MRYIWATRIAPGSEAVGRPRTAADGRLVILTVDDGLASTGLVSPLVGLFEQDAIGPQSALNPQVPPPTVRWTERTPPAMASRRSGAAWFRPMIVASRQDYRPA